MTLVAPSPSARRVRTSVGVMARGARAASQILDEQIHDVLLPDRHPVLIEPLPERLESCWWPTARRVKGCRAVRSTLEGAIVGRRVVTPGARAVSAAHQRGDAQAAPVEVAAVPDGDPRRGELAQQRVAGGRRLAVRADERHVTDALGGTHDDRALAGV